MAPNGIVEAIDVAGDRLLGFSPGLEDSTPDEFGLQRLEEGLHNSVIVAVPCPRHRDQDARFRQLRLVGH